MFCKGGKYCFLIDVYQPLNSCNTSCSLLFFSYLLFFFFWSAIVGERHFPSDNEGGYGAKHYQDKEGLVAEELAQVAADHPWYHHPEVHQAIGKGVVCHLVLARGDLLHHK